MRPLRDLIYVERIIEEQTKGGIFIPRAFKSRGPRLKMLATPDWFKARVISVGPDVRDVKVGDTLLVYTFADGDGKKLYTGENVGEKGRFFVHPDDVICALDPDDDDEKAAE